MGSILGSAIGGISGGPRGSDVGTIVGMAGGAVIGAVVGDAADKAQQRKAERYDGNYRGDNRNGNYRGDDRNGNSSYDSRSYGDSDDDATSDFDPENGGDDVIQFDAPADNTSVEEPDVVSKLQSDPAPVSASPLELRSVRFVGKGNGLELHSGELAKVVVEVYNNTPEYMYNVKPMVMETSGNKHVFVSAPIIVEKIAPGKGIRYTAMVKDDNLIVNISNYTVTFEGKNLEMPPKELELLYFLASRPNQVFTREQILDKLWQYEYVGDTRTVDVHIKRLREKLTDKYNWSIFTVWGIGYKFEVK